MGDSDAIAPEGTEEALEAMERQGLLLSSADSEGRPNVMTIGWGSPGIVWGRPIFTVLVRPSRYTFGNIEATGEFVVNVPDPEMQDVCRYCGTVSGRDQDKFKEMSLTPAPGSEVEVPGLAECDLRYECRVVLKSDVRDADLDPEIREDCYSTGDLHRVYYGQILSTAKA